MRWPPSVPPAGPPRGALHDHADRRARDRPQGLCLAGRGRVHAGGEGVAGAEALRRRAVAEAGPAAARCRGLCLPRAIGAVRTRYVNW
jgi:hypothetical protein